MIMANLLPSQGASQNDRGEDELTEEDVSLLKEAGVLKGRKVTTASKRSRGHVIFADDEVSGALCPSFVTFPKSNPATGSPAIRSK